MKKIPFYFAQDYYWPGLKQVYEAFAQDSSYPGIYLVPEAQHDILPFMFAADTLISDGSSVINEFLALGRCGIIFDLPDEKLTHHDGQPLLEDKSAEWLKDSFIHINEQSDLAGAIEEALNPSRERLERIDHDKKYIFSYTDGQSANRVVEQTAGLLE